MHPGCRIDQVFLCRDPVDFRKSIGGLSVLVRQALGLNPFGSALYVFINRDRNKIKVLYWYRSGFCLWLKTAGSGEIRLAARRRRRHARRHAAAIRVAAGRLRCMAETAPVKPCISVLGISDRKRSTNPSLFSWADRWLNPGYANPSHSTAAAPQLPPRFSPQASHATRAATTCKVLRRSPWPSPAPSK